MLTRPDAAADRARRGGLPLHRGRPAAARRHLVVVGQHSRPLASAAERGARRAGARARARRLRQLHACAGGGAGRAADRGAAGRADSRVLFRQRIDGGRSRAEAGVPVLAQSGPGVAPAFVTLHHAYHGDTVGAMSASEDSVFTRPFAPMLFDVVARARAVLLSLSARPDARDLPDRVSRTVGRGRSGDSPGAGDARRSAGAARRPGRRRSSSSRCCRARAA